MSKKLNLVFSRRPDDVGEEEFNAWYDEHVYEILAVPGYVSAQRFRIQPADADQGGPVFGYLSLYELDGDVDEIAAALDEAVAAGNMDFPEWFDGIQFAGWNCVSIGERVLPRPELQDR